MSRKKAPSLQELYDMAKIVMHRHLKALKEIGDEDDLKPGYQREGRLHVNQANCVRQTLDLASRLVREEALTHPGGSIKVSDAMLDRELSKRREKRA